MFRAALKLRYVKLSLAVMLIALLSDTAPAADNCEVVVKGSVNREVLDYESDTSLPVARGGLSLDLGQRFRFNYTTLHDFETGTSSFTWNAGIKDISGFMDFTSGNYNLHFGSGLMMGKASYRSGDPFNKKISLGAGRTITASDGGNPEYSFHGTVFDFYKVFEDLKIDFIPFYSLQRRYIPFESSESGIIDSSLFSLNAKVDRKGKYTEPVNIINYGAASCLRISDFFTMQGYCFETDLKSVSGKDILWDGDKDYAEGGVNLLRSCGIFAEYADSNISLFIEPAMSSVNGSRKSAGYAVAYGTGIHNSTAALSIRGKNCGSRFHSEYSSGSRTPERIWETKLTLFPFRYFQTGVIVYSEKDLLPSYNRDYTEGSIQEEFFIKSDSSSVDIDISLERKEHYSTGRTDPAERGYISAGFHLTERTYLKLRTSARIYSGVISYLYSGEIKIFFPDDITLGLGWTEIRAKGDLPYYSVISPASEHSSITSFRDTAHGGSISLKYKNGRNSFYGRFTAVKTGNSVEGDAESGLVLLF